MTGCFSNILDLLVPERRASSIRELEQVGLINSSSLQAWTNELAKNKYNTCLISDLIGYLKIRLDAMLEDTGGQMTKKKTLGALDNATKVLNATGCNSVFDIENIQGRTFLDFGSGVYSSLSVSIVLFANGFSRAISYEPFPIDVEFVATSVAQTLQWLLLEPSSLNRSGISDVELKRRVTLLDFQNLKDKLQRLNNGEVDAVDFGGVQLTNNLVTVDSADLVISNSVLEHVADLETDMQRLHAVVSNDGVCVHTVDFSDHRAIASDLYLFQMYYDGILENINGLRPSQVENIFYRTGFTGARVNMLNAPTQMRPNRAAAAKPFSDFDEDDLSVWVNGYVLRKST